MNQKTNWWRRWEITIDSDWITTIMMAVLFIICGLLLAQEIRHVAQGHFRGPERLRITFWSIWNKVFEAIAAIYFFMFAFKVPKKSVKTASILMGTDLAVYALLSCFHISLALSHIVAISGSAVRQIALIIYCVEIARWLMSVFHRSPQPNFGDGS
jgi:hypothetical protein